LDETAEQNPAALVKGTELRAYGDDPMQVETTRLMGRVKDGDAEAYDELVTRLRNRAFQVARSLVGSREDALELSQEAFLKAYRARGSYRDGEPFLPWFHRILRNTCYSFLRRHKKVRVRSLSEPAHGADDDAGDWELEGDAPAPDAGLVADERAQAFWSAFNQLSARDREILALRHFEELAYREIANELGIPEGTVMSRLFHARKRLRARLEPVLGEDDDTDEDSER
jgi:RNA polymerase sigma-70 factor (ECF subfamily)